MRSKAEGSATLPFAQSTLMLSIKVMYLVLHTFNTSLIAWSRHASMYAAAGRVELLASMKATELAGTADGSNSSMYFITSDIKVFLVMIQ
jgi:hypothetical protein